MRLRLLISALMVTVAVSAEAAQQVTATDLQRLQDASVEAEREIATLRTKDAPLAGQLDRELGEVRDDIAYLRGKLRREGRVSQSEVDDVRSKLERIGARARSGASGVSSSLPVAGPGEVPVGTELDVRLQTKLSSDTAQVEDRFEATTVMNLDRDDRVLIPAGSVVRGIVTGVHPAGRLERKGSLTVSFDQITVRGQRYPIRATVTQALESEGIRGEAGRIGAGAGVGAIIGGILGGLKGVLTGILVGGGGVIAATEGRDVELPPGSILRLHLDSPLHLDQPGDDQRRR